MPVTVAGVGVTANRQTDSASENPPPRKKDARDTVEQTRHSATRVYSKQSGDSLLDLIHVLNSP